MTELPPPTEPDRPALRRFSLRRGPQAASPGTQPAGPRGPRPAGQPGPQPYGGYGGGWPEPAAEPRRGRLLAPVAAAVAVVAVAAVTGGVIAIRHNGSAASQPPQLALVDAGIPVNESDTAVPAGAGLLGGDYTVTGTLPTTPTKANVRNLPGGQASAAAVGKLASTLGLSGTPKRVGDTWVVVDGSRQLRVLDSNGQQWLYDNAVQSTGSGGMACHVIIEGRRACLPGQALPGGGGGKVVPIDPPAGAEPGDSGAGTSGGDNSQSAPNSSQLDPAPGAGAYPGAQVPPPDASSASGGGAAGYPGAGAASAPAAPGTVATPVMPIPGGKVVPLPVEPAGPTPDEAKVRAAAMNVLGALGLGNADVRVQTFPGIGLVTAAPVVDGLPTAGFEVRLQYNAKYELTGGSGWLATPTLGADYPLVTAKQALDALPKPEIARVCTDRMPATCAIPRRVITGARLGLALRHNQSGPLLVPAWLYTLQGSDLPPMVVIAVDPRYLSPDKTGGGSGPGVNMPLPAPAPPTGATGGPPIPLPKPTR